MKPVHTVRIHTVPHAELLVQHLWSVGALGIAAARHHRDRSTQVDGVIGEGSTCMNCHHSGLARQLNAAFGYPGLNESHLVSHPRGQFASDLQDTLSTRRQGLVNQ